MIDVHAGTMILGAGLILWAGVALGARLANSIWIEKSSLRWGRMHCRGRLFWVVAADNRIACNELRELLEAEQDRREAADAVERLRAHR